MLSKPAPVTIAKLYLNSEAAIPKFFQPRSVPYAVKPAIDQELERLESSGVIHPVSTSEWAAPIVPVPKKKMEESEFVVILR